MAIQFPRAIALLAPFPYLRISLAIALLLTACGGEPNQAIAPAPRRDPSPTLEEVLPEPSPHPVSPTPNNSSDSGDLPLLPTPFESPEPLPIAEAAGNYRRTSHRHWIVVDPDPAGLNCRWSEAMPTEWYSPAAQYPSMQVNTWPVVHQFPTGTKILANITPAGFATMFDDNQNPWLKVSLGENDEICLVRAHQDYVRPIK
jgi:hypothetical protein